MPRRDGSFTFTFSKRNADVKKILAQLKSNNENFVVTDYMCEAVRFYEKNRGLQNGVDKGILKALIAETLSEMDLSSIQVENTVAIVEEKHKENHIDTTNRLTDYNSIDISALDED